MTCGGEVGGNAVAKALSRNFANMPEPIRECGASLLRAWRWLDRSGRGVLTRGVSRRLRVAETVALGEKRFVSILQVDGEQFLVGGSASSVVLLAKLQKDEIPGPDSFESVYSKFESRVGASPANSPNPVEVAR